MLRYMSVLSICLALGALTACGPDDGPQVRTTPSASPTPTQTPAPTPTPTITVAPSPTLASACPNEEEARADKSLREGGVLEGDVDGDGAEEEVWLVIDPAAGNIPCSAFIVVSSDGALRSVALGFPEFAPGLPRLNGLINVNVLPGAEIVVDVTGGASTRFLAIYAVSGNTVVQMLPKGASGPEEGLFGYGGSVGHLDAIDCVEGYIVISSAVPVGESMEYEVTRRDYQPQGLILIPGGKPLKEVIDIDQLDRYPEFASGPLGSCPRV